MKCRERRTFFNIFKVFDCRGCRHLEEDEFIIIGNNNVSIYHLFEDCPHLEIDKDYLYFYSQKLKRLMLDAIIYQEEILLIFIEEFFLEKHFDIIEKLLEVGLSIQIITE